MFGDPFKIEEKGEINQELFNTIEKGYKIKKNYTSRIYGFIITILNHEINDLNTFHQKLVDIKFLKSIFFVKNKRQKI